MKYRHNSYTIQYLPKPIPTRRYDWSYWHDDYDGAPDAFDHRHGDAASVEDCKREIDEIEAFEADGVCHRCGEDIHSSQDAFVVEHHLGRL